MKQLSDKFTRDAFDKPARGRPRSPNAKSLAQRQREFRQRQKFNFLISVTRNVNPKEVNQ
ncbi:hypothetical protein [Undibacterium macrobrachii]|uniref:Uncharacterized protein n=1 Tax=Undibacterium macrobrachii TaxID=1119058 RepID=A0ABQ2XFA7_9BURK|nr:hypothetical protein [Undibacterium macrobrachii]GGX14121.1 hypothetical protein GCM10011282_20300 [Undibacterium macrobrachii]